MNENPDSRSGTAQPLPTPLITSTHACLGGRDPVRPRMTPLETSDLAQAQEACRIAGPRTAEEWSQ